VKTVLWCGGIAFQCLDMVSVREWGLNQLTKTSPIAPKTLTGARRLHHRMQDCSLD
jgi:hypothetical protein